MLISDNIEVINQLWMFNTRTALAPFLTTLLSCSYRTPQNPASFKQRIAKFEKYLDKNDRRFQIRPPDLSNKKTLTFPITIPLRVRHRYNPKKLDTFIDNSSKIHWNRLTPNQILLGLEHIQYLEFNEMLEGLRYLSQIKDQELHDWNAHPWVSKALNRVNEQFGRIKRTQYISMYYLMKRLKYSNPDFWKKIYNLIEQNIYDLYPSQLQKFFIRYYRVADQYFSPEMKAKLLTLVEGRLRSFSPEGIVKAYEIFQEDNKLNDYLTFNAFIPLFKNEDYTYTPKDLHQIFRFMLILGHQKDDRLYASLYKRFKGYETLTDEELDMLQEVIGEIKDLFVTHRVDPYIQHLKEMRAKMKELKSSVVKQIPIHELVRQDLVFYVHQKKLKGGQSKADASKGEQTSNPQ